ncbi:MAG: trigger factor [Actinomycetota bacterium]|jgi:trigger factor|nr:trigger factor [Actinomycetota bacterium]
MQSTITPVEGSIVKIIMDIDELELEPSLNAALTKISKEVRIPGFRQGKVPRKVLEAKLGRSYIRAEAINEAISGFLGDAIRSNELDVIATQNVNVKSGEESGPIVVEADVEVRPEVNIAGYKGVKVVMPSPDVTDKDVEDQLKRLREQFGELSEVETQIAVDHQVSIDVRAERDGERVPNLDVEDFLYRVGADDFIPGLDDAVIGHVTNDEVTFEVPAPEGSTEGPITCFVTIKKVNELLLPEMTDEWAAEASEFETLAELENSIKEQLKGTKKSRSRSLFRDRALAALIELMDLKELPQALVQQEFDTLLRDFSGRLEAQGIPLEQYLAITGSTSEQLVNQILTDAQNQARVDLVLRALVREEAVAIAPDELEKEIRRYAESAQIAFEEFRDRIVENGQIKTVELEMAKAKALERFLELVEIADEDGNPIGREFLEEHELNSEEELAEGAESGNDGEEDSSRGEADDGV